MIQGFSRGWGEFSSKSAVNLAWPEQIERTAADLIPSLIQIFQEFTKILVEYLANYEDQ